jgi:hypothetical protein
MSNKNPHEPGTAQSTSWAMLELIRKEQAKRKRNTKGAFGGKKR